MGEDTFGVYDRLKNIAKQMILGFSIKGELCKNWWTDLNNLYIVWRAFVQRVAAIVQQVDACTMTVLVTSMRLLTVEPG